MTAGKTDGPCRGAKLSIHVIDDGTGEGKVTRHLVQFYSLSNHSSQEYSIDHLSNTQVKMLEDLHDYGMIWQRKVGAL